MRAHSTTFRLTAAAAIASLVAAPALPVPAFAQTAPATDAGPQVTPPLRVGRLAWIQGTVSFHTADQDSWNPAVVNYPVTAGDGFWTQPGAEAGLQVSDVAIDMSSTAELDIDTLDNTNFVATEPQGEVYVHVRDLQPGETYTLQTPRGTVTINTPGQYEIAAGSTQDPTLVTVLEGAAQVGGAASVSVAQGQTAVITGDQNFQAQLQPAQRDAFLTAMLAREQQAPAQIVSLPVVAQQMPGVQDLSQYGSWSQAPTYGQVWYPQVPAGWAPYRDGYWSYVAPWGWTWIDSEPWGFAPFHYGRWVSIDGRWAWTPAIIADQGPPVPCYAPALVTFFGVGAAIGAGIGVGALLSGSVGWVPLGWGEPYHPWFHASPGWVRDVNIRHVTNINAINTNVTNVTINHFANSRGATVIPASAMVTSRPVRAVARPVQAAQLAQYHPVIGRDPVPPNTATRGVTPAVAREMHIGPPPAGITAPPRERAPGPAIRAQSQVSPGEHPTAPTLRAPETNGARPGAPATAAHLRATPGVAATAPALRPPGTGRTGPPPIEHQAGPVTGQPNVAHPGVTPEARVATPTHPEARTAYPPPVAHAPTVAARPGEAHPAAPVTREAPREAYARPAAPAPRPEVRAAAPVVHEAPRPAPAPRPEVHAAAPVMHEAPHPAPAPRPEVRATAPVVHEAPRPAPAPRPEVHAAAPVVHEAPRPAPAPAAAPPRPAAPRPAPQREKKPGEP